MGIYRCPYLFVLSGYLLSRPYLKALSGRYSFPATIPFYVRRLVRIYPPYFAALLVYIGLRGIAHAKMPDFMNMALYTLLFFNYGSQGYFFSINPAFWSLSIEVQFYIILPVIAGAVYLLMHNKRGNSAIFTFVIVLYVIGILSRSVEFLVTRQIIPHPAESIIYFRTLPSYLDLFGAGVLVASLEFIPSVAAKLRHSYTPLLLFTLGSALFLIANIWCSVIGSGPWLTINNFWFSVAFPILLCLGIIFMMIPIVLNWGERMVWLNSRPIVAIGAISYSVYLYHIGIQFFILKTVHLENTISDYGLRNFAYSLISFIPVIVVSAIMYWIIERPCLNYLSKSRSGPRTNNVQTLLAKNG